MATVSPCWTGPRVENRQPKSLTSSMKVRSVMWRPLLSISVTSTGTCTKMRLSALFSIKCRFDVLFSSDTVLPRYFHFIVARAVPKKMSVWTGKWGFTPSLTSLAFHNEKPVPKRDAGNSHCLGWPLLGKLVFAVRSEVRRAGPKIGTRAPRADSGRLLGWATCKVVDLV